MTLYELIDRVSRIMTPDSNAFYRYVLYTSDDNGGFLRTRFCWWDAPVKDCVLKGEYNNVLVASKMPINKDDLKNKQDTLVKLQFTYSETDATIEDAEWDIELGYCYIYIFNLKTNNYTLEYSECPY